MLPVRDQRVFIVKHHARSEALGNCSKTPERQIDTAEIDLLRQVDAGAGPDGEIDIRGFRLEQSKDVRNDDGGLWGNAGDISKGFGG